MKEIVCEGQLTCIFLAAVQWKDRRAEQNIEWAVITGGFTRGWQVCRWTQRRQVLRLRADTQGYADRRLEFVGPVEQLLMATPPPWFPIHPLTHPNFCSSSTFRLSLQSVAQMVCAVTYHTARLLVAFTCHPHPVPSLPNPDPASKNLHPLIPPLTLTTTTTIPPRDI